MSRNPTHNLVRPLGKLSHHRFFHLRKVQNVSDTILPVVGVHWSPREDLLLSFSPHSMKPFLMFVDPVTRFISFEHVVEPWSLYVHALGDHIFGLSQEMFFPLCYVFICLQLPFEGLGSTRVKDIRDATV